VKRHIVLCVEGVDAGRFRNLLGQIGGQTGRQLRLAQLVDNGIAYLTGIKILVDVSRKVPEHARIGQCPVAVVAGKTVPRYHAVQIVPALLRVKPARKANGAQHIRRVFQTHAAEFVAKKSKIEPGVVCDEGLARQPLIQISSKLGEGRSVGHHGVSDSGQGLDHGGNRSFRVDQ
jgi:hypothetical protein